MEEPREPQLWRQRSGYYRTLLRSNTLSPPTPYEDQRRQHYLLGNASHKAIARNACHRFRHRLRSTDHFNDRRSRSRRARAETHQHALVSDVLRAQGDMQDIVLVFLPSDLETASLRSRAKSHHHHLKHRSAVCNAHSISLRSFSMIQSCAPATDRVYQRHVLKQPN